MSAGAISAHDSPAAFGGATPEAIATGPSRLDRWAPMAGVVFALVFVIGFLIGSDIPAFDASGSEVIDHYEDAGRVYIGIVAAHVAGVSLVFFAGALRNRQRAGGHDWLATTAFGGCVVLAVGLGVFGMTQFALLSAADLGQPEVAQALNVVDNDNFLPAVIGVTVTLLATGLHALASRSLPRWLGWTTLILGIVALAGPIGFIAVVLFPAWVLTLAVVMLRRPAGSDASSRHGHEHRT